MALELDMTKAYDGMELDFMEEVLKTIGFHDKYIKLVKECVSSVSYYILLNGYPFRNISPTRGLRQGDPLSAYIFIMGVEVLSKILIKAKKKEGKIHGVKVSRSAHAPSVSHLFFADDSFIFVMLLL